MTKRPFALGGRTWAALLVFGLFGQIAWVIENMYFNVFLYNTISGDPAMIAAMVAWSAVTATVTTLVMGALSDKLGRRKAFIVAGYLLWGVSIAIFGLVRVPVVSWDTAAVWAAHATAVLVVILDCMMTFFGSTANDAAFNAWVTDVTVPENRGRVETVLGAGRPDTEGAVEHVFLHRGRSDAAGRRAGLLPHQGAAAGAGAGDVFLQHPVRPAAVGDQGAPGAVSGAGVSGGVLHEPAGVHAVPHHLHPAVPGHHGLHVPAGRGADRQLGGVGADGAAHRPAGQAAVPAARRRCGRRGTGADVLRPGPVVCAVRRHRHAGRRHGGLRLLQRADPGLYAGGQGRAVPGHPHFVSGAAAHGDGAVYRRGRHRGHGHDL